MRHPNKPRKPALPWKPTKPKKTLKIQQSIYPSKKYPLQDFTVEQFIEYIKELKCTHISLNDSSYDGLIIDFLQEREFENEDYEWEYQDYERYLKDHEKKLPAYNKKLDLYKEKLKKYEEDLIKYNKWKQEEDHKTKLKEFNKLKKELKL